MIYFVQAEESRRIKIGYTSGDGSKRIHTLKTASPESLRVLGVIAKGTRHGERRLHELFATIRFRGEWFHPTEDLLRFIRLYAESWDPKCRPPLLPPHLGGSSESQFTPPQCPYVSVVDFEWRQCDRCERYFPSESRKKYCRPCGKALLRELQVKGYLTEVDYEES